MDQTPEAENLINWAKYMNSFWLIEDYIFAKDFVRFFDRSFQKNVKSHVFLKSEKNVKYVFSNTGCWWRREVADARRPVLPREQANWSRSLRHLQHDKGRGDLVTCRLSAAVARSSTAQVTADSCVYTTLLVVNGSVSWVNDYRWRCSRTHSVQSPPYRRASNLTQLRTSYQRRI